MKSRINLIDYLTTLDWIIFSSVLLLTLCAIIYGHTRSKRQNGENFIDYILMGRQLTLPLFVATLVATWYGGIFGVTEISFNYGIYNFITQGVFWYITYILFALFLVKKIRPYHAVTLPDLVLKMFGPRSAKISAIFNFFNVVPISYCIGLGIFMQAIFGGHLVLNMCIGTFFILLYSIIGGFRAVVFSDLIQFFVMCFGVVFVVIFSIHEFGGVTFLKANLPATHFSPTGGNSISTLFVWGLIALSTLVDPNFYQRCFAAKNQKVARNGIIISTIVWFFFDICTTLGGMYAKAVIPEASSSQAYLTYAVQILPSGLRGFVLAGILATVASTFDSYVFLAGTTLTHDILPRKWHQSKLVHHLCVVFVAIIAIFLALSFEGNIKNVWKTLGSYSSACLLFPMVLGHLIPGKIRDADFLLSCIGSAIATTYWRNTEHQGFYANIDEIYIGLICSCVIIGMTQIQQRFTKR